LKKKAAALWKQGKKQQCRDYLTTYCEDNAADIVASWKNLWEQLVVTYNDGYRIGPEGEKETPGYPAKWLKDVGYEDGPNKISEITVIFGKVFYMTIFSFGYRTLIFYLAILAFIAGCADRNQGKIEDRVYSESPITGSYGIRGVAVTCGLTVEREGKHYKNYS